MIKIIITVGVPGSGKSTLATQLEKEGWVVAERDRIRFETYGIYYGGSIDERVVTKLQQSVVRGALLSNKNLIISDTNLDRTNVDAWIKFVSGFGRDVDIEVRIMGNDMLYSDFVARNGARLDNKPVPIDVINKKYAWFREQYPLKASAYDPSKQDVIVFDIDGTVASMGDRSPYNWSMVGHDAPISDVIDILTVLKIKYALIAVSGRDASCYTQTMDWLVDNGITPTELYMRDAGSMLRDSAVKHDIYHTKLAPKYNVVGVFDDRDQVVRIWRAMGVRCYQVQYGDF